MKSPDCKSDGTYASQDDEKKKVSTQDRNRNFDHELLFTLQLRNMGARSKNPVALELLQNLKQVTIHYSLHVRLAAARSLITPDLSLIAALFQTLQLHMLFSHPICQT